MVKKGIATIPLTQFLPFAFLSVLLIFLSKDNIFFWDTVQLGSKHAHWFYENNFTNFLLPDNIDSGHPPVFGIYLAGIWMIFGKSLITSHFAMLPFLLVIIYQSLLLGKYFLSESNAWIFPSILFANSCFLGHSILISPDIPLIAFFLLSFYSILKRNKFWTIIGILLLSLISTRGMILVFCLFLHEIIFSIRPTIVHRFREILPKYLIGSSLAILFIIYHFIAKEWIGFSSDSPWASNFEWAGFFGLFKNMIVFIWKLIDFGNVFLVISIGVLYYWHKKQKRHFNHGFQLLLSLLIVILIVFAFILLPFKSLINPRYLLPAIIIMGFTSAVLFVPLFTKNKIAKPLFCFLLGGLFLGNLWIYPKHISQGWDVTLAHYPYYDLRTEMMEYIDMKNIDLESIGTEFPNRSEFKYLDLTNDNRKISKSDFDNNQYILYSNIMNDFKDHELYQLETEWTKEKEMTRFNINMILYKRK